MTEASPEDRRKIQKALREGKVEFTPRAERAISNMDLHNPDYTLITVNVSFWGPYKRYFAQCPKCNFREITKKELFNCPKCNNILNKEIFGNGGGMGIDWETKSAGCGRCDIYIEDGKLRCMNEAMDKKFILDLLNHIVKNLELDM